MSKRTGLISSRVPADSTYNVRRKLVRRNPIVSALVTAITTASVSMAPVSHSRSSDIEPPSFEEIERSSEALPATWLEKQVVDRLQFLLGKGVSISKDQAYELSKLVDRVSSFSKISDRGLGVMAQLLTREFNDAAFFETIPRPAIAQFMSAQSKAEEKLLEYAKNGKLPDSVLDGLMAEPGRVSGFARTLVLQSAADRKRQERLLEIVSREEIGKWKDPFDVLRSTEFKALVETISSIDLSNAESRKSLSALLKDSRQPARVVALMVARPQALSEIGVELGSEFLDPMVTGAMQRLISDRILESSTPIGISQADFEIRQKVIYSQVAGAYQRALRKSAMSLLDQAATEPIREEKLPQIILALDIANRDLSNREIDTFEKLMKTGLAGGPAAPAGTEPMFIQEIRRSAIVALGDAASDEAFRAFLGAFDDPNELLRMTAGIVISRSSLTPSRKALLQQKLAELEAKHASVAQYLLMSEPSYRKIRTSSIGAVGGSASFDPTCPKDFGEMKPASHLRLVK